MDVKLSIDSFFPRSIHLLIRTFVEHVLVLLALRASTGRGIQFIPDAAEHASSFTAAAAARRTAFGLLVLALALAGELVYEIHDCCSFVLQEEKEKTELKGIGVKCCF